MHFSKISRHLSNKKPAEIADSLELRSSSINTPSSSIYSVSYQNILSSPGPAGNCTPEILLDEGDLELLRAQGIFRIA